MDVLERRSSWSAVIPFPALAAIAQLVLTLPLAFILNVGQDDAYTLHTTARGLGYAFTQSITFEQNAPFYFIIMTLWRHLDSSAGFARLFSVFCAAGSVSLIPAIVKRYMGSLDERWVTLSIAFNPFLIYMALEIRVYALIGLLSAALLIAFYDAFWRERPNAPAAAGYAALAIAALYTQYYLLFILVAQGVAILAARRRSLLPYAAAMAAALLAFVPMLAILPSQMQNFRGAYAAPSSPLESFHVTLAILLRYVVAFEGLPHPGLLAGASVLGAGVAALSFRGSFRAGGDFLMPAITLTSAILFSLAIYATHEHVLNRHLASLFFPATLSVYSAITFFREPARWKMNAVWSTIALLLGLIALGATYRSLAKPGDWIRVNGYLRAHEQPGQPIAVFQAENAVAFEYYYRGPNRVVPIPEGVDFRDYDVSKLVVHDVSQLDRVFPRSRGGVWLVNAGGCRSANVAFGCDVLERFVNSRFRITSKETFYKASVRLLVPR